MKPASDLTECILDVFKNTFCFQTNHKEFYEESYKLKQEALFATSIQIASTFYHPENCKKSVKEMKAELSTKFSISKLDGLDVFNVLLTNCFESYERFLRNPTKLNYDFDKFYVFISHLLIEDAISFERFKIYFNALRHLLLTYNKKPLFDDACKLIESKLNLRNLTIENFIDILEQEKIPNSPFRIFDDDESYKFDAKNYKKLNIKAAVKDVPTKFKEFLENEKIEEFDVQMINKCNEDLIDGCALYLLTAEIIDNDKFFILMENYKNLPKFSIGNSSHMKKYGLLYQNLYDIVIDYLTNHTCKDNETHRASTCKFSKFLLLMLLKNVVNLDDIDEINKENYSEDCLDVIKSAIECFKKSGIKFDPEDTNGIYHTQKSSVLFNSLDLLIRHISHSTFTDQHILNIIKTTKSMFDKCSRKTKENFHQRVARTVTNVLLNYFPTFEYENISDYSDKALNRFCLIISEFYNLGMVKHEVFEIFLMQFYKTASSDHFVELKNLFFIIFTRCFTKISENFGDNFDVLFNYSVELQMINDYIKYFDEERLKEKLLNENIYAQMIPQIITKAILKKNTHIGEEEKTIQLLKNCQFIKKIHIDKAMREQFENFCRSKPNNENWKKDLNSLLHFLRELIFFNQMTRRGVARIYQTIIKFTKFDDSFEEILKITFAHTCESFLNQKDLTNDITDILTAVSEILKEKTEYEKIFWKLIKSFYTVKQKKATKIANTDESNQIQYQKEIDQRVLIIFMRYSPINLLADHYSGQFITTLLKQKGAENTEKLICNSLIKVFISERDLEFNWRNACVKNPEIALKLISRLFIKGEVNNEKLEIFKELIERISQNAKNVEIEVQSDKKKKKTRKPKKNKIDDSEVKLEEFPKIFEEFFKDKKDVKPIVLKEKFNIEKLVNDLANMAFENFEFCVQLIGMLKNKTFEENLEKHCIKSLHMYSSVSKEFFLASIYPDDSIAVPCMDPVKFKMSNIFFIKMLFYCFKQQNLKIEFIISLIDILIYKKPSEYVNFNLKVIMQVFGKYLDDIECEQFLKFFKFINYVSENVNDDQSKVCKSICELRENNWKITYDFNDSNFNFDELLVALLTNDSEIDEFYVNMWRFILNQGTNENILYIFENFILPNTTFVGKFALFMFKRFETFSNLGPKILDNEKVKAKLGKVSVLLFELYKITPVYSFIPFLTEDLIEKIPIEYVRKMLEIASKCNESENKYFHEQFKVAIKQLKLNLKIQEEKFKNIDENEKQKMYHSLVMLSTVMFDLINCE
ncbi:hypothetical protein PVAND_017537 [Polypedilum vanderplanki]|uniref:Uncharacterized protein n=1 Tax=Polypedilum vanderplanki TaxID=319348 RepID=A0A9J6BIK6_POLVA|nr:hypothetical protein PVAND_017537 [Polypedilum vanderplanki]